MKERPAEGLLERMARTIVAEHLDVQVVRADDGLAPSQPDGLILLPDGRRAPLEVVSDHDVHYNELSDALKRQGDTIPLPGSSPAWYLAIRHDANLKRIRSMAPRLLESLPAEDLVGGIHPADTWSAGGDHSAALETLSDIGISYLSSIAGETGVVKLRTHGWSSWGDPVSLLPWIERVLARENDVPSKLKAVGGDERHAFIWATLGSAFLVTEALTDMPEPNDAETPGPDAELLAQFVDPLIAERGEPLADPTLPDGVTHLWVASTLSGKRALHWNPTAGWSYTGWRTPQSEHDIDARLSRTGDGRWPRGRVPGPDEDQ